MDMPLIAKRTGSYSCPIVGESRYLESFTAICGERTEEGVIREATAVLLHEDENPYDEQAVVVRIENRTVGYLSRIDARTFRSALRALGFAGRAVSCSAQIRGGWDRGFGDRGEFGVRLAIRLDALALFEAREESP